MDHAADDAADYDVPDPERAGALEKLVQTAFDHRGPGGAAEPVALAAQSRADPERSQRPSGGEITPGGGSTHRHGSPNSAKRATVQSPEAEGKTPSLDLDRTPSTPTWRDVDSSNATLFFGLAAGIVASQICSRLQPAQRALALGMGCAVALRYRDRRVPRQHRRVTQTSHSGFYGFHRY